MKKVMILICLTILYNCKENNKNKVTEGIVNTDLVIGNTSDKDKIDVVIKKDSLNVFFNQDSLRTLSEYKNNISKARDVLNSNNSLNSIVIESLIPVNFEEYKIYYGLTYSTEEDWVFFRKVDNLILENSNSDNGNCLEKYSNLAEFVDGEYAESFYDNILFVAKKNPDKFCKIFDRLSIHSKKNLMDVYEKICF